MSIDVKPPLAARFAQPSGWQWNEHLETRPGEFIRIGWVSPQTPPRALIVIFGGLSEYCEKYFEVTQHLLRENFAVTCMDWRGQGMSWRKGSRDKRYHDDFTNDVKDAEIFLKAIPFPDSLPRVLLGHSMGAHIGLRVMHDIKDAFKCAVLTSAFVGLAAEQYATPAAAMLSTMGLNDAYVFGYGPWSPESFDSNIKHLTSDDGRRDMQRYWMDSYPDLRMGGLTVGWLHAALTSLRQVRKPDYLKDIHIPCLLVRSGEEKVVSNAAIEKVASFLPHAQTLLIEGALHEVMMEKDVYRNQFWTAFHAYVDKYVDRFVANVPAPR